MRILLIWIVVQILSIILRMLANIIHHALSALPNIWISIAGTSQLVLFVILLVHVLVLAILDNLWLLKDRILIVSVGLVRSHAVSGSGEKVFGVSFVLFHHWIGFTTVYLWNLICSVTISSELVLFLLIYSMRILSWKDVFLITLSLEGASWRLLAIHVLDVMV